MPKSHSFTLPSVLIKMLDGWKEEKESRLVGESLVKLLVDSLKESLTTNKQEKPDSFADYAGLEVD